MPKKPFSGKQKREQLRAKRDRVANRKSRIVDAEEESALAETGGNADAPLPDPATAPLPPVPALPAANKAADPNRYKLRFAEDSEKDLQRRRRLARLPLCRLNPEADLQRPVDSDDAGSLDMPKRPPWGFGDSREELERREARYFCEWVARVGEESTSYFELNLETWRQLWRVIEIADVVLIVVDARFPSVHFPPSLYRHVVEEKKKAMIMVVNKVDLVPAPLAAAWISYFRSVFPSLRVVCFSSFPLTPAEALSAPGTASGKGLHRKRARRPMSDAGPRGLLEACRDIVGDAVDLTPWERKLDEEDRGEEEEEEEEEEIEMDDDVPDIDADLPEITPPFKNGVLTIGCCGFPNVGKSSVMNALVGKKVVSVSATPGHTKHFQTYFLADNVVLCDCPGLVFPSRVERTLQILTGMYPVSQVREPYTAVGYLAERIDLPHMLRLDHPDEDQPPGRQVWSAMDVCEAWAERRGFVTNRGARNDVYRAANELLRLAVDGKIVLCLRPPEYDGRKWAELEEAESVRRVQSARRRKGEEEEEEKELEEEDDNDEDDDDKEVATSGNVFAILAENGDE